MQKKFILSCESTVDMPYEYVNSRDISVLFYSYAVDGKEYTDDMLRDEQALLCFYRFLNEGKIPSTSQINEFQYAEYLDKLLQKGDVVHIALGSGMTPSVNNAKKAGEYLQKKYPERKLVIIDSLCSSSGYGMLVDTAADMRDNGCGMEEVIQWVNENRKRVHHQFYSTDLKYFRRSGRISGSAAMIGSVLNICPIMRLDDKGRIIAYDKVRGKKKAIERTVATMAEHAEGNENYCGKCFICHSNSFDEAMELKESLQNAFPKIEDIKIFDIGTIIASHCGPGTVAVFFMGDEREAYHDGK